MNKEQLRTMFDEAHKFVTENELTKAFEKYEEILAIEPDNDAALHLVAVLHNLQGNHKTALEMVLKAIGIYSCDSSYYTTMANIYRHLGDYKQSVDAIRTACELKPNDAINISNAAMILAEEKRYDRAKELYLTALEIEPECPFIHFNLSLLLLKLGEFKEGWKEYDWRLPFFHGADLPTYPEELKGKKIRINHEQGYGDFIMFARYFKLLEDAGAEVYVNCPKPLAALFPTHYCDKPDYTLMTMSLPNLFDTIPNEPYIKKRWHYPFHEEGFKIGVAWMAAKPFNNFVQVVEQESNVHIIPHPGNFAYLSAFKRSLPHDFFDALLDDNVLYNLQTDTDHYAMQNMGPKINNFADLADMVKAMDLIISIDTALAHLAGAMGKEVWLLLPYDCDWRWRVDGNKSHWYPSMKIFRQSKRGSWDSVQKEMLTAFAKFKPSRERNYNLTGATP
jgi:Tfp pilus assembly protein PilF